MAEAAAKDQLGALIETIEKEAYKRGYDDAVQRILAAANPGAAAAAEAAPAPKGRGRRGGRKPAAAAEPAPAPEAPQKARRAPRGSVPGLVDRILREAGEGGLKPAQIAERVSQLSRDPISAKSVTNHLHRSKERGSYRNAGGRWFLNNAESA